MSIRSSLSSLKNLSLFVIFVTIYITTATISWSQIELKLSDDTELLQLLFRTGVARSSNVRIEPKLSKNLQTKNHQR